MNNATPDNDRNAANKDNSYMTNNNNNNNNNGNVSSSEEGVVLDATEKDEKNETKTKKVEGWNKPQEETRITFRQTDESQDGKTNSVGDTSAASSYSNKLEKFETLSQSSRSRLKRSESLNKRSESVSSKLKRSESLNKHSERLLSSASGGKLKRSESLNKHTDSGRSESPSSNKLKRSESLTKTEKTECNISKRRQSVRKDSSTKLKRKNGMPERSIKRRHTVGGTKDFDKVHWLDNRLQQQYENEKAMNKSDESKPKKSQLRTSSPDLSSHHRLNMADTSFLIEVSFRGPSNVVFNVTNATRPQSLPDANLASKVFKVPLESHV